MHGWQSEPTDGLQGDWNCVFGVAAMVFPDFEHRDLLSTDLLSADLCSADSLSLSFLPALTTIAASVHKSEV